MDLNNIDIKQTDEGISIPIATVNEEGDVSLSINVDIDKNSLAYKACETVVEGNLAASKDIGDKVSDVFEF